VPVPVPQTSIQPGDVIRESQIIERQFDARIANREFYQQSADVIGKVSRRILLPGRPIPLTALKEAYLVSAGEIVNVLFSAGGLEVTGRALALQSGRRGEVVACRNIDSGVVIRGTVTEVSLVQLGGD
jgi:flagella basal body P-ring formation protein FlgA